MAEEGIIAYLFLHQDKGPDLYRLAPPEKFITAFNRGVYKAVLGKTIGAGRQELSLADLSEELSKEEMSGLCGILARHRDAPPKGADVQEYIKALGEENARMDPAKLAGTDDETLRRYFEELRKRKA